MTFIMKSEYIEECNETAVKIIKMLFSKQYMTIKEHKNSYAPPFKTKYFVQTGMRSNTHEIQIILGLSEECVKDLLEEVLNLSTDKHEQAELLSSALGELTNTIAGHLATHSQFKGHFGLLYPSPPDIWVVEDKFPEFSNRRGLSSRVISGNLDIHTHLSIHSLQ